MFDPVIWLGAVFMGISLGLLGSGGSILTLPLLVYIAKEPEKLAVAESLLIVGVVALIGSMSHLKKKNINFRLVLLFGLPSMFAAFAGAHFSQFITAQAQLIIFALVMIAASLFMLWPRPVVHALSYEDEQVEGEHFEHLTILIIAGISVGMLAGIVGVGGGFLIVPALLLIAKTPIYQAIATSLFIIALQSLSGFSKYAIYYSQSTETFNWPLLLLITSCALCGVFAGTWFSEKLPQAALKRLFGMALIPLSVYIFYTNI